MSVNFNQGLILVEQCQTYFAKWLQQLLKEPNNQSLISQSEKLAVIVNQLVKQHPLLSLSLLQCPKQSWPWSYRYIFHFALLTSQLANCNQWHEKVTEILIRSSLLTHRKRMIALEKWAKGIPLGEDDKRHFLSPAVLSETDSAKASLLHVLLNMPANSLLLSSKLKQDVGNNAAYSLLMLSSQLALRITPGAKRQACSVLKAIKLLAGILPPSQYQRLNTLLKVTGMSFPASLLDQQKHYLLAKINPHQTARVQIIDNKPAVSLLHPAELNITHFAAPAVVENSCAHLQQLWPTGWQREKYPTINQTYRLVPIHYRLDLPPPALADFHQQLQQNEPDTKVLTRLIESEQHLAKYMCLQAEVRSRLNIKVQQVKQALLVQGFERSFHILSQQALCVRLYQYRFPGFETLQQLTPWHAAIASQLAAMTKLDLLEEEVQAAIYFYHSGVFISPRVKSCYQLTLSDDVVFSPVHLFKNLKLTNVIDNSIKLGEYWRQPSSTLAAFRLTVNHHSHSSTMVMKLSTIIQLSLAMTQQTLRFGQLSDAFYADPKVQATMQQFALTERQFDTVVNDALHIVSPCLPLQ
ncbi:hypothetical protein [Neptunicella marina]|uniref:HDOD domain-containing protein n=1 Tax=Neptunicella marina TaxID=2125989 RepID=A0A8J6IS83_9ALTE|nr:hypothetical protein [Neptunicella marina]MBC3764912.1 hypothetical protein [Neptunicella marina]